MFSLAASARSLRALFSIVLATAALAADAQEIRISELMAAGQSVVADEDGAFPDWIELHNVGPVPVSVGGWALSDDADKPFKWRIPGPADTIIPAGGYLVIFASDKETIFQPFHTGFSLRSSGETLTLRRPDGTVADTLTFPQQIPDISFDHEGRFLTQPTPGAANSSAVLRVANTPQFSQSRGFQDRAFLLSLTCATPGAAIRFTLDGTEPTENTGTLYTTPLRVAKTTVVRAAAFAPEMRGSPVATSSYLFLDDIVHQSPHGEAPKGWPKAWGQHRVDYGMDPRITNGRAYKKTIENDLRTIPSLSIVMPLEDLFAADIGIYANPYNKGREWERAMSMELINPDGTPGFQINGGLRIRGGASRDQSNPKHSFRVIFRKEYGAPELEYPVFGPGGAAACDKFDLRCDQLVSWHYSPTADADFLRDQFGRDTQFSLGEPASHGAFFHLYINGQYWGLYNTDERLDADFGARHFGGSGDDYDVVKFDAEAGFGTGFTDGTFGSWRRLFDAGVAGFHDNAAYFAVQGRNPDGSRDPDRERLLDVDSLIGYMLAGFYIGVNDSPPSFGTQNNWSAIRSREGKFGFRFFAHDWELSLFNKEDKVFNDVPEEQPFDGLIPEQANPWHFFQALRHNTEFRLRFADHAQRSLFNGGPLTPEVAAARFQARMEEIDRAVVGESARWGDAGQRFGPVFRKRGAADEDAPKDAPRSTPYAPREPKDIIIDPPPRPGPGPGPKPGGGGPKQKPFTREDWLTATHERLLQNYFPERSGILVQQLREAGLFPAIGAPEFSQFGGIVPAGAAITLANPNTSGTIYFTLDGSDPREIGGAVSDSAQVFSAPISFAKPTAVKARVLDGQTWSALVEAEFQPGQDFSALKITEVHYNPPPRAGLVADDDEFIELKNTGAAALDLSGLRFIAGVDYTFPANTQLAPGGFWVLVRNAARFAELHPGVAIAGVFSGKLSDDGETLTLATASGAVVRSFAYDDGDEWPAAADGYGFSLVLRSDDADPDNGINWRVSAERDGSPGADDPAPPLIPQVVVNELLLKDIDHREYLELQNLGDSPADVSGWWLSDHKAQPRGWRIPAGTVVPPQGFQVILLSDLAVASPEPLLFPQSGGEAWIFSADAAGELTGYLHGFAYAAQWAAVGRVVTSEGREEFPSVSATRGSWNVTPTSGTLTINEVHYAPAAGGEEFVELRNAQKVSQPIGGYQLAGFGYTFPSDASIPARGLAVVTNGDPAVFRAKHQIPPDVPVFGPALGALQDGGERLELLAPMTIDGASAMTVVESLRYNDRKPWPVPAAGFGASLQRIRDRFGNFAADPENWVAGLPSPGRENMVTSPPRVSLNRPANGTTIVPPRKVEMSASVYDRDSEAVDIEFLVDGVVVGSGKGKSFAFEWTPTPGLHDVSARAVDDSGAVGESDFVTIYVDAPEGGVGLGLRGEYFANRELEGSPAVVRDDAEINFDWVDVPPTPELARDNFSVRWSGRLLARESGSHTLYVRAFGGVRLRVGGELVIDQWTDEGGSNLNEYSALVDLVAGEPTEFTLEYFDADGFAHVELLWSEPGSFQVGTLPQSQMLLPTQDPIALGITTRATLPARKVGHAFSTRLQAANGTRPYTWTVLDPLPSGVTLREDGVLSGTPTQAGISHLRMQVADAAGAMAQKEITLRVTDEAQSPLRPVVRIASPQNGARFGDGSVIASGIATAPHGVASVRYVLNDGIWHELPGTAQWSVTLDALRGLRAGRNTLGVQAIDAEGRESAIVTRVFHRFYSRPLTVGIEGAGSVTPGFLGITPRMVGQQYTIAAKAAPGFRFSEWRGLFDATPRLTFTMDEGLAITAVFVPNPFVSAAGTYTTLLTGETDEHSTRGSIALTLTKNGALTGVLQFAGQRYPLRGEFTLGGFFNQYLPTPDGLSIDVTCTYNFESGQIDTTVGRFIPPDGYVVSAGTAVRSGAFTSAKPHPFAGRWTLALPHGEAPAPQSDGSAAFTISRAGRLRLVGKLGDGTAWTTTTLLREDFSAVLYSSLYTRAGSLSGPLSFTTGRGLRGFGQLFWSHPPVKGDPQYPEGFQALLDADATPVGIMAVP